MMYPDYQRVDNPQARERFAKAWGVPPEQLDDKAGLTVVEVIKGILAGNVKGMYIMGENPAMSDPDADHAREALAKLEMLVVQDIFLTETAYLADVILPASSFAEKTGTFTNTDRFVQLGRQALEAAGQGAPGSRDHHRSGQRARPVRGTTAPASRRWPRCSTKCATPCRASAASPGSGWRPRTASPIPARTREIRATRWCSSRIFPTATGKAKFVPADIIPADERPDGEYPMVLITGRQLEHWHTGSMTRRSGVLDSIEPDPVASLHPLDLAALGRQARRPDHHRSRAAAR